MLLGAQKKSTALFQILKKAALAFIVFKKLFLRFKDIKTCARCSLLNTSVFIHLIISRCANIKKIIEHVTWAVGLLSYHKRKCHCHSIL